MEASNSLVEMKTFTAWLFIPHLIEQTEGFTPDYLTRGVDTIFDEICEKDGAHSDGSITLFGKIMVIQEYIYNLESKGENAIFLAYLLKEIKRILSEVRDPIRAFLGGTLALVDAILSQPNE